MRSDLCECECELYIVVTQSKSNFGGHLAVNLHQSRVIIDYNFVDQLNYYSIRTWDIWSREQTPEKEARADESKIWFRHGSAEEKIW